VNTGGGDFVGRDKVDQSISVSNVSGIGIAIGHGATASVTINYQYLPPPPVSEATLAEANAKLAQLPLDSVPPITALPTGTRLRLSPNPNFVGRETEFKRLAAISSFTPIASTDSNLS